MMRPVIHQYHQRSAPSDLSWRDRRLLSLVLLICVISLNMEAYGQSFDRLAGTWAVDLDATIQRMSSGEKAAYDSLSVRAKNVFKDSFASRKFQFQDGARVSISFQTVGGSKLVEGSWLYEADGKKLSIAAGGINRKFVVKWLDEDRIVLVYQDLERGSLLRSLCLNRR